VELEEDLRGGLHERLQEMVQLERRRLHGFGQGVVALGCVFVVDQSLDAPEDATREPKNLRTSSSNFYTIDANL
jgi:hypothetical protein